MRAVGKHADIAWMRIAVKQADLEGHLHEDTGPAFGEVGRIDVHGGQGLPVVDAAAVDEIHGQDGLAREFPIDLRNGERGVVAEEPGELLDRAPFTGEIQFAADRAGEMVDQSDGIENVRLGNVPLDEQSQLGHQREIAFDFANGVGPANFDRQLPAVVGGGPVDLCQGAGGQRDGLELGKEFAGPGRPSSSSTTRKTSSDGNGRTCSCSEASSSITVGGNQVGPRAQDLAEFDERGSQVFQSPAKAAGPRFVTIGDISLPQEDAAAPAQVAIELELLHDVAETVLQEDGGNLAAAAEIAEEAKRMRFRTTRFRSPGRKNESRPNAATAMRRAGDSSA